MARIWPKSGLCGRFILMLEESLIQPVNHRFLERIELDTMTLLPG